MLARREVRGGNVKLSFRDADAGQIEDIVRLLADDPLGENRERFETPLPAAYVSAFEAIVKDPNNELIVGMARDRLVGVLQLTYLPNLTYMGRWRAQIEGVRIARDFRAQGAGRQLFEHAIERARCRDCHLVQLTTDQSRPDTLAFYEALGFTASHVGLKLHLPD